MTVRDLELCRDGKGLAGVAPRPGGTAVEARQPRLRPLLTLQGLRGIAALIVVVTHAANAAVDGGFAAETFSLPFGNFGVDIFFVISGFIIVYSSSPFYRRPRAWRTFVARRLIRVVPLYWIVISLYLLYRFEIRTASLLSSSFIIKSYLFIPHPEPEDDAYFPFYFPGWTLEFEMFFYACFSVVLSLRRSWAVVAVSGLMLSVLMLGVAGVLPPTLAFWSSSLLCEFIAGCFLAEAYLRGARIPAWFGLLLSAAATLWVLVSTSRYDGIPAPRGIMWGLPAAALVMTGTLVTWPKREDVPGGRAVALLQAAFVGLGDASYSLYVTHLLVILAAISAIQGIFRNWHLLPVAAYMALMLVLTVGVAVLCFRFLERPVTRRMQRFAAKL